MVSKKEIEELVKRIMTAKGLPSQRAVSIGANLAPDTVAQLKHKKEAREGLKESLEFAYKDVLNNSLANSEAKDQSHPPSLSAVLKDLKVIVQAVARIEAALKMKGKSKSGIAESFEKVVRIKREKKGNPS